MKYLILYHFIIAFKLIGYSQPSVSRISYKSIDSIAKNASLSKIQKLDNYYKLKIFLDASNFEKDSVYAKILHNIGLFESFINKNYKIAIDFTLQALRINTSKNKCGSNISATLNYYNLGYYYKALMIFDKSLVYYDSASIFAKLVKDTITLLDANVSKQIIFYQIGDYQKCTEECLIGINYSLIRKDTLSYVMFLNQKAESLLSKGQLATAIKDVELIIRIATRKSGCRFQLASALKTKGRIYQKLGKKSTADSCFQKAIQIRIQTKDNSQISLDYIDFGNFYQNTNNKRREKYYVKAIEYAKKAKDSVIVSMANTNLGEISFEQKEHVVAGEYYLKALLFLKIDIGNSILLSPTQEQINKIANKELIQEIIWDKANLLLSMYQSNHNVKYLNACLQTALLTDTLITKIRQLQLGNESKLIWRNKTRNFYNNALEACYLADKPKLAFYFMEKSRAILLNDRLNELGAASQLPPDEAEKEEGLRIDIIQQEQKLAALNEGSSAYKIQELKLVQARNDIENYHLSLEQKFPVYYQYKYNDQVPDLQTLQQFLAKNNQAFVHYFIADSLIYMLGITPNSTKLIKASKAVFNVAQLSGFSKMCADYEISSTHYDAFVKLSNSIYSSFFKPLQLQQNRVVICADNFLIPFGALCTDNTGKHFLIQDHAFSYAYSARSLLKPFNNPAAKGDLLGIAPVSFAPYLKLPTLKQSSNSLQTCSKAFNNVKLLLDNDVTKYSFIKLLPNYSIVNVFSHASVDSSGEEPLLFMADSVINLSELQKIKSPATQLVVLSACQTNVGKLATGEGIYSLARGFASSGIPSVAATLWKADEDAIYEITQSFDQNLANGMRKDDALQQAELAYIKHGDDKRLPFFWANMVLVGNAGPVKLSSPYNWTVVISIAIVVILVVTVMMFKRRKAHY